ncbi:flippase-like domain-containing protein [Candidatus Acetothermia bacterium]|nr:flippase-like domain-containing protein [Candidatus Acetothermia bacterium]MCI2426686.1 flippase-like domain-containing protein [Candidatus Acetothermia bacterium]MCI2428178.1 flippase-like domain-containing protein [Candidatus Acetothermia bacterium]
MRKRVSYLLSSVAGVALLVGIIYYIGWGDIYTPIIKLGIDGLAVLFLTALISASAGIASWWIILRSYGIKIPLRTVCGSRLSGQAISYLTPSMYIGGEPVRALLVFGRTTTPKTRIAATIIVERFLSGLSFIVFILVGTTAALIAPAISTQARILVLTGTLFIGGWLIVGLVNFAGNRKWISKFVRKLERRFPRKRFLSKAAEKIAETEEEIYVAFTAHRRGVFVAFLIQSVATFFIYLRPYLFFYFVRGMGFTLSQLSLLFTLNIMLSLFLWLTPGGIGIAEGGRIGIFALVGVSRGGAVAFSLIIGFLELLFVAVGLSYLLHRGIHRRRSP